ncbi:MAG: acyl-CoA dehydrogenase family protein [Sphingomonadaceae bacterium]
MDFTLSEDQQMLMTGFEGLLSNYRSAPHGQHGYVCYSPEFQQELRDSGFLEIASQPGFGLLEAAMLVEEAATCPISVEAAASMMIGPLVGDATGPVALVWHAGRPVRFLAQARTLCLFEGDDVLVGDAAPRDIEALDSVAAYPMARLRAKPAGLERLTGADAAAIRRRAQIGIAAEAAGLMRGALDNTVAYVKEREQYGQPLGHFQAIQHRLAEDAQIVRAAKLLALRAAFEDSDRQAAIACLYAQDAMRKVIYDCHQFSGAMGLTLEFPLHLWTYRLKVLQGEAGGRAAQGRVVSRETWGASQVGAAAEPVAEGVA